MFHVAADIVPVAMAIVAVGMAFAAIGLMLLTQPRPKNAPRSVTPPRTGDSYGDSLEFDVGPPQLSGPRRKGSSVSLRPRRVTRITAAEPSVGTDIRHISSLSGPDSNHEGPPVDVMTSDPTVDIDPARALFTDMEV